MLTKNQAQLCSLPKQKEMWLIWEHRKEENRLNPLAVAVLGSVHRMLKSSII